MKDNQVFCRVYLVCEEEIEIVKGSLSKYLKQDISKLIKIRDGLPCLEFKLNKIGGRKAEFINNFIHQTRIDRGRK